MVSHEADAWVSRHYRGRWLRVEGVFRDAERRGSGWSVDLQHAEEGINGPVVIGLSCSNDQEELITAIRPGYIVRAEGKVRNVSNPCIFLNDAKIIDFEPPPSLPL